MAAFERASLLIDPERRGRDLSSRDHFGRARDRNGFLWWSGRGLPGRRIHAAVALHRAAVVICGVAGDGAATRLLDGRGETGIRRSDQREDDEMNEGATHHPGAL